MELQNNFRVSSERNKGYDNFRGIAVNIEVEIIQQQKKIKKRKHISRPKSNLSAIKSNHKLKKNRNNGHWSMVENKKYFLFLKANRKQFQLKTSKKCERIFKLMAAYLQTRTSSQCRSHHQKMQKKCQGYDQILNYLFQLCQYQSSTETEINEQCKKIQKIYKCLNIVQSEQEKEVLQTSYSSQILEQSEYYFMPQLLEPEFIYKQVKNTECMITGESNK